MYFSLRGGRQIQPYVSWKGTSTNSAVPTFSKPLEKNETAQTGPDFKARPIKHWRKQLNPVDGSGRNRSGIGMPMDTPGGAVYLGTDSSDCASCGPSGTSNAGALKSIITADKNNVFQTGVKIFKDDDTKSSIVCIACNPENNVIKPASTVISKKYYSDRKAYLESRCLTYNQRLSGARADGVTYFNADGSVAWPSNSSTGSQVRDTLDCYKECKDVDGNNIDIKVQTIYKPSNNQFATQGAVSSSDRLLRLKLNTVNKNGSSFRTAYGDQAANAGKYRGNVNAPYFIKSKTNNCRKTDYHRNGQHTMCFTTNTGSIGQVA